MQEKRRGVFRDQYNAILEGLKLDNKFWLTYVLDLIFYSVLICLFFIWGSLIKKKLNFINSVDPATFYSAKVDQLDYTYAVLQSFLIYFIISIILAFLIGLVVFSIFKGNIWSTLVGKKRDFRYFKNLFFTSLIFFSAGILIFGYFAYNSKVIFALTSAFVIFYLSSISLYSLTKGNGFWRSLGNSFKFGIKIQRFILFAAIFLAVFFIVNWLSSLLNSNFGGGSFYQIAMLVVLILFFSVARNCFIKLLDKIWIS